MEGHVEAGSRKMHNIGGDCCVKEKIRTQFMGLLASAARTETLHVDTNEKPETFSIHGYSYFGEYSRSADARPILSTAGAASEFFLFIKYFEKRRDCTVLKGHTDEDTKLAAQSTSQMKLEYRYPQQRYLRVSQADWHSELIKHVYPWRERVSYSPS